MSLAIWLVLIVLDVVYEMFGVFRQRSFEKKLWGDHGPQPLTFYVRELMKAYWPAKLTLIVFWVWLGFHFWVQS